MSNTFDILREELAKVAVNAVTLQDFLDAQKVVIDHANTFNAVLNKQDLMAPPTDDEVVEHWIILKAIDVLTNLAVLRLSHSDWVELLKYQYENNTKKPELKLHAIRETSPNKYLDEKDLNTIFGGNYIAEYEKVLAEVILSKINQRPSDVAIN